MTTAATSELSVFVERKPGWIVEITVEAPPEELDRALGVAGRKLGARLRIPGFRPGKAPAGLVERAVGWEALRNAAAEELVPQLYARAVDQEDLDPVGDPSVTLGTVERGQPVKFTAEFTVRPVVAAAKSRSVWRQRKAGICSTSTAWAAARHWSLSCTSVSTGTP